jgi:molybdenum cofactor cytidylyltransferase
MPERFVPQAEWDGAAFLPGDLPFMEASVICRAIQEFAAQSASRIVIPVAALPEHGEGCGEPFDRTRRGNPVVWPKRFFNELQALRGDNGGRHIIARLEAHEIAEVDVGSARALFDVDTPGDLARARSGGWPAPGNAR